MDVMIDIETLANTSNSVIVQIGSVIFNRHNGDILDTFKTNVNAQSGLDIGLEMNVDTIEWWMKQSEEARQSIFAEPRADIKPALESFSNFIVNSWCKLNNKKTYEFDNKDVILWCHATFDEPVLENAYQKAEINTPWHFRGVRDLRTLVDASNYTINKNENVGTAHDALDDCLFQINYVVECFRVLNGKKG